jgi:elongation factor P
MDTKTYDQLHVSSAVVGDAERYLLENQEAIVATHDGAPLFVELPASVELVITYTEPGCRATARPAAPSRPPSRPARRSQVPLFLEQGTKVKVDTRDGSYLGRVND